LSIRKAILAKAETFDMGVRRRSILTAVAFDLSDLHRERSEIPQRTLFCGYSRMKIEIISLLLSG